ncbi:Gfo/Idh/MocA family oxidoreductase [Brooklawnia cerclae]|uniref:Dehydrogenase n=1 Tax=Brooklawnia cerclae TaxID=349934 RepID=A0ABX0SEM5_9ACTN|nr:Gfo/Idh/MocA family oxidoreductase [Brooklawnia cerclae]NIH56837.1 putative dehydrogenase [Brooklawnia cerclae]
MVDPVRVAIVGGGIRGSIFARVVGEHPRAELAGICEPAPPVAERLASEFDTPIVGSVDELLDKHAPDAVIIATPDFAHVEVGLAVLGRGLHAMFEKPLATTVEEAGVLRDAASASPGKVMVGFENRWNPKFQAVKRLMGQAGAPLIAQRILLQDTEFVPRQMLSWAGRSTPGWFLFPHTLDMAMWLSGARPVEAYARGVRKVLAPDGIDTWDRISATILMSDDSIVTLDSGWVLPESRPAVFQFHYEVEAKGALYDITIDDSGITHYSADRASYVGTPDTDSRGRLVGAHIDMIRDFIDLCDGQDVETPDIEQGYEVTMAIAAIHESLRTNANVRIRY